MIVNVVTVSVEPIIVIVQIRCITEIIMITAMMKI